MYIYDDNEYQKVQKHHSMKKKKKKKNLSQN